MTLDIVNTEISQSTVSQKKCSEHVNINIVSRVVGQIDYATDREMSAIISLTHKSILVVVQTAHSSHRRQVTRSTSRSDE